MKTQPSSNCPNYISQAGLLGRGWTKTMIAKLLGEPDKLTTNPYRRLAAPMRLYDVARVQGMERLPEFKTLTARR